MKRTWLKRKHGLKRTQNKPLKSRKTPLKCSRTRVYGENEIVPSTTPKVRNNVKIDRKGKVLPSVSKLKKRADAVFSLYIRTRDNGVCFTCGVQRSIKEMQNGHFVSRVHNSLRFDERNCNCQCPGCNVFKHGNMDVYALRLTQKYGPSILAELNVEKRKIKQFTREDLLTIINTYSQMTDLYTQLQPVQ